MATLTSAQVTPTTTSASSASAFASQTTSSGVSSSLATASTVQATLTATLPWANGYAAAFTLPSYSDPQPTNLCSLTFILTCTLSALCSNRPTLTYQTYRGALGTPTLYTFFSSSGWTTSAPAQISSSVYTDATAYCSQNGADQSWTCAQHTIEATYTLRYAVASIATATTIPTTKTFGTEEMGYAFVPVTAASSTRGWFGFASTSTALPDVGAAASNLDMCIGTVASVPAPTASSSGDSNTTSSSVGIAIGVGLPLGLLILGALVWKMVAKEKAKEVRRRRVQNELVVALGEVDGRMMDNSRDGTEMQEQRTREQRNRREQEQIPPPAYEA